MAEPLDVGRTEEDPEEGRRECDPRHQDRGKHRSQVRIEAAWVAERCEEADELHHHDQRPGRRLGHAEAVEHLARGDPHVGFCRGLGDVGEHGVGATERDDGHLAEEDGKPREHLIRAKRQHEQSDRREPEHEEDRGDPKRAMAAGMRRQAGSESKVGIGQARPTFAAMPAGRNTSDPLRLTK